MPNTIMSLITILVMPFLNGCMTSNVNHFSYKSNWYAIDTEKRLVTSSSLISYGDYLFEFIKKTTMVNSVGGESDRVTSVIHYDTTGVYILAGKNSLYYEFDTFAVECKIVKTGKLSEKSLGQLYPIFNSLASEEITYSTPVDTVINNITCFYANVVPRKNKRSDSTVVNAILIKKPQFNSLYKIGGAEFPDKDYCIVGLNIYSLKNNDRFVQDVDALRPLTEKERRICEGMVIRSKACVVDTIKGYVLKEKRTK